MQHPAGTRDLVDEATAERGVGKFQTSQDNTLGGMTQRHPVRYGHHYGNIAANDGSTLHIGDTVNQYHVTTLPQMDHYATLHASLTFARMDARLRNVAAALPRTCEWLIWHDSFLEWCDVTQTHDHHGFLWIKGKPGSGKSTIMKETLAWAEKNWSSQITLSYFFNARSPDPLERSSLGLYRSLLYQLLCSQTSVHDVFVRRFASKVRLDSKTGQKQVDEWTETEIQNFFFELVTNLHLPAFNLFVDALDEGDNNDVRTMVRFLERLTDRAAASSCQLRVCLSSRHYPYITMKHGISLDLGDQMEHNQDIDVYVQAELMGDSDAQMDDLRSKISCRSNGVFLWVVLITNILNKMYDEGATATMMSKRLDGIPSDLHLVFSQILSRDLQGFNESIELFRWVLFSLRPLRPIELYTAAKQSSPQTDVAGITDSLPENLVAKYLLHCSRGLVEVTKTERYTVQFIHESVRTYLLSENAWEPRAMAEGAPINLMHGYQADISHLLIAESCLRYLLNMSAHTPLTLRAFRQNPLASYASDNWWHHVHASKLGADTAPHQTVLSLAKILLTDPVNYNTWMYLYEIRRDEVSLKWYRPREWREKRPLRNPLALAAMVGIPELLSAILQIDAGVENRRRDGATPLLIAAECGWDKIVRILLDAGADVNAGDNSEWTALKIASFKGFLQIVQILVQGGADINFVGRLPNGQSALRLAVAKNYDVLVQYLLQNGADVNIRYYRGGTVLQYASMQGLSHIVQLLLDAGADLNARDEDDETALHSASSGAHTRTVQLLINAGADVNAKDRGNETALEIASWHGHAGVAQVLIDKSCAIKGADDDTKTSLPSANSCNEYSNALWAAARSGHLEVVQLLVDAGASVNARREGYGSALQAALECGNNEVVLWLLNHGADVNTKAGKFGTALEAASARGHKGT